MKSIASTLSSQKVLDIKKKKGRKQDPEPEEVNHLCSVGRNVYLDFPYPQFLLQNFKNPWNFPGDRSILFRSLF